MRLLHVLVTALLWAVLAVPFVAASSHGDCGVGGNPALGVIPIVTPVATFYVDDRNYLFGDGIWVYEETNGIAGLQRGGSSFLVPDDNEICIDDSPSGPDTLIF